MLVGTMNNPKEDLIEELSWIIESGFDFVELTVESPMASRAIIKERIKEIKDIISTGRARIIIAHTAWYLPIVNPYDSVREASIREIIEDAKIASEIESIEAVVVHTHFSPGYEDDEKMEEMLLRSLRTIEKAIDDLGLKLYIENDPISPFSRFEYVMENLENAYMCLDIGHAFVKNALYRGLHFAYITKRLAHIHAHDNKGAKDEHLPIGSGKIPWDFVIATLKSMGYDGTITLEDHSHSKTVRRTSLKVMRELIEKTPRQRIWELLPVGP